MKVLVVGDVHAVPDELQDCTQLLSLVRQVCREYNINEVWWSGDQFNTHSVLRMEVVYWWKVSFKALRSEGIRSVCLVGNHDQSSPGSEQNAMRACFENEPGVMVVDKPMVHRGVLMVPYMHSEEEFLKAVNASSLVDDVRNRDSLQEVKERVLFCHQTFNGCKYENGFLASDGFDLSKVPQGTVISGHIHTGQSFDKLWYVGAPRWRTLSDANVDRAVWMLEFSEKGELLKKTPFDTSAFCRPIRYVEDTPDSPIEGKLDANSSWRIDVKGPESWCESRKNLWLEAGARVRTFPEKVVRQGTVRESEGIEVAFKGYLQSFSPKYGTPVERLAELAKERL